jgi:hypothetical protein
MFLDSVESMTLMSPQWATHFEAFFRNFEGFYDFLDCNIRNHIENGDVVLFWRRGTR